MKPHVVPRIILKQFSSNAHDEPSVVVLYKKKMVYRNRGINHQIFKTSSNYYGNGEAGTLERELASNDESSISKIIQEIRDGIELSKEDLHFLLWNNTARNPIFRGHPKVEKLPNLTSENFHRAVMDSIPDEYLSYDITQIHIKSRSNRLVLPDFSIKYMVLAPDVVIIRTSPDEANGLRNIAINDEENFVQKLNKISIESAIDWLVSESESQFEKYGAKKYTKL